MSILCIGQTAYDITLPMNESIVENQKYRIFDKLECLGGPAANAAYLCAKWDAPTMLMSRIANDTYGNKIIKDFQDIGLNCDYIVQPNNFHTPLSIIINNQKNGNRTILNNPGILEDIEFKFPKDVEVILMDGHELASSLKAMERYPDAISILDAGTCRDNTMTLGRVVDYLVCSQDFARQYANFEFDPINKEDQIKIMKELKKLNHKHVVITLGEKGLLYEVDGEVKHLDAYQVKTIDTTGAGDIFHGAFAYAMYRKYELLDALKIASMTSAISVGKIGGQTSIPDLQDVLNSLER